MRDEISSKMDKKNAIRRAKRQAKVLEENYWDCSVCTYRNTAEAFKCLMCDVRKGTSTRKPRINPAIAAQQAGNSAVGNQVNNSTERRSKDSSHRQRGQLSRRQRKRPRRPPRLSNVDRSSAQTREVTVNSVTVMITEYKPKKSPVSTTTTSSSDVESCDARA